ncbi:hypothetical protein A11M_0118460 [Xanthomonas vasicola pv. vasculorum NCPPB 895]|uniref:hypothetical protein n=1 Tax=Xanthomonas vasicola TaxID=56459 RepID=UPI000348CFCB|nr:hypothetical protein [Xanthomonas vasicola]KEZ95870.1 hypothetical protein A11M_0118460 [Xanthomonas vasicola pv. vasculorum NCPPB 895]
MRPINRAFGLVSRRAERSSGNQLLASFVDVGDVSISLGGADHQVMYGRRGTGKTHVLSVLAENAKRAGGIAVSIDLRTIGSTGGIYSDYSIPLPERATRLLADVMWAIHDGVMAHVLEDESLNLGNIEARLDCLRDSISDVRVIGQVTSSSDHSKSDVVTKESALNLSISKSPSFSTGLKDVSSGSATQASRQSVIGDVRHRIHFGSVAGNLVALGAAMEGRQILVLLDEWSEIPLDLQPYLADLLRRVAFPVRNVTIKIAAIEQRTNFQMVLPEGGYIGIEIGADGAPSLTLDDFMVFDNDANASIVFFRTLLWRHATTVDAGEYVSGLSDTEFMAEAFTQVTSLQELVRASEGVPRDAINIAALSARLAGDRKISVHDVRGAARQWYQQSKEAAVSARPRALDLLQWIIEQVIAGRRARAFLLPTNTKHDLIDYLYDSRVIHVLKKGVSSNDTPGVRYNVYGVDYGCYVDLISTINAPQGLFPIDSEDGGVNYVDVPTTDYRSIRRAILNLQEFERLSQS